MASVVPLDCSDGRVTGDRCGWRDWCVQLSSVVGGSCSGEMWKCGDAASTDCSVSDLCGCGNVAMGGVAGGSWSGEMWGCCVAKAAV